MRTRMRSLALTVVLATLIVTLRLLSRVVPQTRTVVVSAFPESEGNATETARALLRRYPGRVVWLREAGEAPREVRELAEQGVVLVPKVGLGGIWAYLRAEAVLFTHGLYGSPRPVARKPVVNLWHGDGPKDIRPGKAVGELINSTYVVGSTPLFTHLTKCAAFAVPRERAIITGNPRTDLLWRPADAERLRGLGVAGDFVVWMPTWRRSRAVGAAREKGVDTTDDDAAVARLLEGLRARGMQLVVKPHPMDADRREGRDPGNMVTVAEGDLVRAGVTLYELLGASAGLVTDYSSVWVDYLLLDRPVAFLVTDRHTYGRSLFPADILGWLPGELVESGEQAFGNFLADLDADGALGATARKEAASRIGLNQTCTAADDLLDALAERGVLRLR
jgi:hypothetical protein